MPLDKIKPPARFPDAFHQALLHGPCVWPVFDNTNKAHCLREARRYRAFLKSLTQYPYHPTAQAIAPFDVSTKVAPWAGGWLLQIIVKPKISGIIAQALEK